MPYFRGYSSTLFSLKEYTRVLSLLESYLEESLPNISLISYIIRYLAVTRVIDPGKATSSSSSSSSSQQIGGRHNGNHIYFIFHFVLSYMNVCMFVCIDVSKYVCTYDS